MNKPTLTTLMTAGALVLGAYSAQAQSSSLYASDGQDLDDIAAQRYGLPSESPRRTLPDIHPAVPRLTTYYFARPEPREFLINDLITIIVRESFESELESEKSTEKDSQMSAGINAVPPLQLKDLLNLQINGSSTPTNPATLDIGASRSYEGEGEYERTESMTGRVRARIIDIKPNGMLVLEARRTIINDGEQSVLVATGNCMPEDVGADNSVLSTQLENLFIDKQHSGDLRDSNEKGWLTRMFEAVFDF